MQPVPLQLETLDQPASHQNAAGRVDRSACLAVPAAKLWRHIPAEWWRPARSAAHPGTRRPDARTHREAFAHLTLTATDLDRLLDVARPFQLLGDFRTEKANAMKRTNRPETGRRYSRPRHERSARRTVRGANPNLGAAAIKTLGLSAAWSQTLRLERWRLHARLARHFVLCPCCAVRKLKLYIPLCTPAEARDARFAADHLTRHPANKPLTAHHLALIERYAHLLPPRSLRCADCLNLRFGYIHPRKDATRQLSASEAADDPVLGLLALPQPQRQAALLDHIADLQRRRGVHRRLNRIRNACKLIQKVKATEGDDLAFLSIARKLIR